VQATSWRETIRFVGRAWSGAGHVVGFAPWGGAAAVPPPGRHVHVASLPSFDGTAAALAAIARHIVVVGTDDPGRLRGATPTGARIVPFGLMQRPPLDGPVDRRSI
jgi:hypothetical protein